jgi:4-diphosphocytidyl-2-C-methyl-D-erythritol kinase
VNLFLAVGPRDESGYHPIRTIFQAVGIYDRLTIEPSRSGGDDILCDWPSLPAENTLTHGLRLVRELVDIPPLRIELEKNIPPETGLGGGSSDAAGLLRAISRMSQKGLSSNFLMDVAAAVGKDVPFFLMGGRAKGEGYGERLAPLPDSPQRWFVIVRPQALGSTKEAYARLDELDYEFCDFPSDDEKLYNDFERVAPEECLEFLGTLGAYGASGSLLCGSGAGVFGMFEQESDARQAVYRFSQDSRIQVWLAPSLTREESLFIESE